MNHDDFPRRKDGTIVLPVLVRRAALGWPLCALRGVNRKLEVAVASACWAIAYSLYCAASVAAYGVGWFKARMDGACARCWFVLYPFKVWGGAENFRAQRQYDALLSGYDATDDPFVRNQMVHGTGTALGAAGLMDNGNVDYPTVRS